MLTGADHIGRLQILPALIRKYMKTENVKYLKQASQICNDHKSKIREFKRIIEMKIVSLKKEKKSRVTRHNQVPFPGLKNV